MLLALACSIAVGQTLSSQAGREDITPPEPLPLGGYTERGNKTFQPGGEHLFAHALIIRQGSTKVAVVSLPMLTVPESLYREVRKQIPKDLNLFLCASHTHSAPDSQMLNEKMTLSIPGIASYKPRWLEWYARAIAVSVLRAERQKEMPAKALGVWHVDPGLNRGRRTGAQPDRIATVIHGLANTMTHYAAHAVVHDADNLKLSADWPGAVTWGRGGIVLPGAIGDVSPAAEGATAEDKLGKFSEAFDPLKWKGTGESTPAWPLAYVEQHLPLDKVFAHPDFARRNKIPDVLAQSIVGRFAPTEAKVTAFRIGKLAIVGIPGEPTSHLGRMIRDYGRRIGFKYVLVCSHVNGWMGYILDPEDYDRGGYEATLSFYGREQGLKVVESAKTALDSLRAPK